MALRYGELVPLSARHSKGWHTDVLAYARYSIMETAIIATNLSDKEVNFWIDLSAVASLYLKIHLTNTIIMVTDWINNDLQPEYYFLREFLLMKSNKTL